MATGGNPHGAYRFTGNSSPGACNSGGGYGTVGGAYPACAFCHLLDYRPAYCAICCEGRLTDSEHSVLYIVAVGYDATHKHLGTAGDEGDIVGYIPSCTAFCCRNSDVALLKNIKYSFCFYFR